MRIPDYGGGHARFDEKILEGSDSLDHGVGEESPFLFGRSTIDARLASEETRYRVKNRTRRRVWSGKGELFPTGDLVMEASLVDHPFCLEFRPFQRSRFHQLHDGPEPARFQFPREPGLQLVHDCRIGLG